MARFNSALFPARSALGVLVASAAILGFAILLTQIRTTDPAVQGAVVGAVAGVGGGILGAGIGAWGALAVAGRTIRDTRDAREEARREVRQAAFLDQRRDAILEFVLAVDTDMETCEAIAKEARDKRTVTATKLDAWQRPWTLLCLIAPDLARHEGSKLVDAAGDVYALQLGWTGRTDDARAAGLPVPDDPPGFTEAQRRWAEARGRFLVAASKHLGVMEYAGQQIRDEMAIERSGWPRHE